MLFQGSALFNYLNIYENIAFALRIHGLTNRKSVKEKEIVERVHKGTVFAAAKEALDKFDGLVGHGWQGPRVIPRMWAARANEISF